MTWRLAKSLIQLRDQINSTYPKRSKTSDGTIGDEAHASRSSDHNPWVDGGVVTAMDITNDPKNGVDSEVLAELFRSKKDPRIKYVISNKKIFSSTTSPWVWRAYTGSNPHNKHVHISVKADKTWYDNTARWDMGNTEPNKPEPVKKVPSPIPVEEARVTVPQVTWWSIIMKYFKGEYK